MWHYLILFINTVLADSRSCSSVLFCLQQHSHTADYVQIMIFSHMILVFSMIFWIFYSWRISNMNSSFTEYLTLLLRHFSDIFQTVENNHYGLVYFWNCMWQVKSSLFCLNTLFVTVFAILNTTSAPKYSLQSIHIFTHLSKIWPLLLWLVLLFLSYLSFPSFLLSYLKISFLERSNWNWNYFGTPGSFQYWVLSWGCKGIIKVLHFWFL